MDTCKFCSNTFKRHYNKGKKRKIYCSKKCKYSDEKKTLICKTCKKEFTRAIFSKQGDFCSMACIQRSPCQLCSKIITGRKTFQGGEKRFCSRKCANFVHRTLNSKKSYMPLGFARSLRDHGKIKCNRCGIDDICVLVVHHIDFDHSNNNINNLETVCSNCHHRIHWGEGDKRLKSAELASLIVKYVQ